MSANLPRRLLHRSLVPPVLAGATAAFVLAFLGGLWLHRGSTLYDTDSYFHLAAARAYAEGAVPEEFPPLRMSILGEGYGDKEWLFHRGLAPLVGAGATPEEALAAGRLALALLAGLIAAMLAALAVRLVGWWGIAVPFALALFSTELPWRLVRLRPELLALPLLLAALWLLAGGRHRSLGVVAFLYTLSYTAFQALLGLVGLGGVVLGWRSGKPLRAWPWTALLYAVLGVGLGLLLHPQFPENLGLWAVQNLQFFRLKGYLPMGTEIRPNTTEVVLLANAALWLALLALWRAAEPVEAPERESGRGTDRSLADVLGVGAAAFGVLYLLMSRFSLYALPLVSLWVLAETRARGRRVTAWTRLPGRGRVPLAAVLGLCVVVALPGAARELERLRSRTAPGPDRIRLADRERLAAALPAGARVAAGWRQTAIYLLWAPQGSYLNALDPLFMALPHPREHRLLREVLEGREPDVPLAAASALGSDHLAFSALGGGSALLRRLRADPRAEALHLGYNALYRLEPGRNGRFVLDWRVLPAAGGLPPPAGTELGALPAYPRAAEPELRALEGWVDGDRVLRGEGECLALARRLGAGPPAASAGAAGGGRRPREEPAWELAASGPTRVWLDRELLVAVGGAPGSVLGEGVVVRPPAPGDRAAAAGGGLLTILTCRGPGSEGRPGRVGFYLVEP